MEKVDYFADIEEIEDESDEILQEQKNVEEVTEIKPSEDTALPVKEEIVNPVKVSEEIKVNAEQQLSAVFKQSMQEENKGLREATKDVLYMASASKLAQDEEFSKKYQDEHSKQLLQDLKQEGDLQAIVSSSKKQKARNERNQAFFDAFRPFFKDFMGIQEAFGLIPMVICVLVLYLPFLLLSVIFHSVKFIVKGINAIFVEIGSFVKIARYICLTVVIAILAILAILALLGGIEAIFNVQIFPR